MLGQTESLEYLLSTLASDFQRVYFCICVHTCQTLPMEARRKLELFNRQLWATRLSARNWTQFPCKKKRHGWAISPTFCCCLNKASHFTAQADLNLLSAGSIGGHATIRSYPWLSHLSVSNYSCDIHNWPLPWHLLTSTNPFLYFWTLWLIPLITDSPELCLFRLLIQLNLCPMPRWQSELLTIMIWNPLSLLPPHLNSMVFYTVVTNGGLGKLL